MGDNTVKELVQRARNHDDSARETLIFQHKALITSLAAAICKRSLHWDNDDELSITLIAFNEAIDNYDEAKGLSFTNYSKMVIHRRLVDYFRQQGKYKEIPLASALDEKEYDTYQAREAWDNYSKEQEAEEQEDMIRVYDQTLGEFGITLDDLLLVSPKHKDTKLSLMEVAGVLAGREELVDSLYKTRQLPIKELVELTGKSRKVIETGRKYIIALAIILTRKEFYSLRTLIKFPG